MSADLFASTYAVAQRESLSELRVDSVLQYGRQAFEDFPDWAKDAGAVQSELNRLKDPLHVARVRLPITPTVTPVGNDLYWLHELDVGDIVRVQQGQFATEASVPLTNRRVISVLLESTN